MLILLPPSEGKSAPRRGKPLDLAALGLAPGDVGSQGSATAVVEAVPRPERPDRIVVTDDGDAFVGLAEYLSQKGFA